MPKQSLPRAQVGPMQLIHQKDQGEVEKPVTLEHKPGFNWIQSGKKSFAERLTRNVAVAAALLLCVVAVRNASSPETVDVFQAIQQSMTLDLNESIGKLTFVSNLLPETALVFWNSSPTISVMAPVQGDIVHVWHEAEPYIALMGASEDVRAAADGEVMNIAHGDGEERIIRIRHDNGLETMYGNLEESLVSEGDQVYEGDIIGNTIKSQPVLFELRQDGRSIDPTYLMKAVVAAP